MSAHDEVDQHVAGRPVRVHVTPRTGRGVYANLALVSHSPHEFTLDLCQAQPEGGAEEVAADLVTRVRIPPTLVPSLVQALQANLEAYQRRFGPVRAGPGPEPGG